jgi:hypothetical protein
VSDLTRPVDVLVASSRRDAAAWYGIYPSLRGTTRLVLANEPRSIALVGIVIGDIYETANASRCVLYKATMHLLQLSRVESEAGPAMPEVVPPARPAREPEAV